MGAKEIALETQANTIINNMKKRHFDAYYCETKEAAFEKALSLMEKGSSVGNGGSQTLSEIGLLPYMKTTEDYVFVDRKSAKNDQEKREIHARIMMTDYFLVSANAFTEDGQLVYIDGDGNRVSNICYGPKHVIVIVSMNKVCPDVDSAYRRIREHACPPNCVRLNLDTPCAKTGFCHECSSTASICDLFLTVRQSRFPGRIKVILVGEPLGY